LERGRLATVGPAKPGTCQNERAEEIAPRLEAGPCRDLGGCVSDGWNCVQIYRGFYRRNTRNQRPNQQPAVNPLLGGRVEKARLKLTRTARGAICANFSLGGRILRTPATYPSGPCYPAPKIYIARRAWGIRTNEVPGEFFDRC
jgi:hypothetical protein